jgi:hypothetical protein
MRTWKALVQAKIQERKNINKSTWSFVFFWSHPASSSYSACVLVHRVAEYKNFEILISCTKNHSKNNATKCHSIQTRCQFSLSVGPIRKCVLAASRSVRSFSIILKNDTLTHCDKCVKSGLCLSTAAECMSECLCLCVWEDNKSKRQRVI